MTRYAPLWQQGNTYPAATDRGLIGTLWPTSGSSGGAATAVSNTMNVSVANGTAAVALASGNLSVLCRWDAPEVVTLAAAQPAGQNRIDLVVLQVRDNALDAGGNNDFIFQAITGTATSGTASPPAVPSNAYAVCQVAVVGGSANLNGATITDRRTFMGPAGVTQVRARAYRNAAWTTPNFGIIPLDTASYGTGFNLSTGVYTCPSAGDYLVIGAYSFTATAAGDQALVRIDRNGGPQAFGVTATAPSSGPSLVSCVTEIIPGCNAGDTLNLLAQSALARAGATGSLSTYMTVRLLS